MKLRLLLTTIFLLPSAVVFGQFHRWQMTAFGGFHNSGTIGALEYFDKTSLLISETTGAIGLDAGLEVAFRLTPRKWSAGALYLTARPSISQVKYTSENSLFLEGPSLPFDSQLSGTQMLLPVALRGSFAGTHYGRHASDAIVSLFIGASLRYAGNLTLHEQWVHPQSGVLINYDGPAVMEDDKFRLAVVSGIEFLMGKFSFTAEVFVMKGGEGAQIPASLPAGYYSYYYNYMASSALVPARVCVGYTF
jgi:hypothetical protein